jgi:phage shock protein PspC (stress-responsive transcriptional regulator)
MGGSDSAKGSTLGSVEETFQDFWANRPLRPQRGGKLGGVAAAIGLRYGIDPILVRVAFVIGAFYGGAGVVLYLLGWLLFPKEGDPVPGPHGPQMSRRPTSGAVVVIILLLLIPATTWAFDFTGLFGMALGIGALYLLHRNYRDRAAAGSSEQQVTGSAAQAGENTWVYPGTSAQPTGESTVDEEGRTQPPAWDPLGAAPFAWDLPEPAPATPEPQPRPPRRHSITLVTLALALIAAGLSVAYSAPLSFVLAISLGVLGAGMIAGAFLRGGRGLIGFAIPVGALAMLLTVIPVGSSGYPAPFDRPWQGVNSHTARPITIDQVRPEYVTSVGEIELNLEDLRIGDGQQVRTNAHAGLGEVRVVVPPNADVIANCSAGLGSIDCLDESLEGRDIRARADDLGNDGTPGGGQIVLDLSSGTGDVEVTRG